MDNIELIQKVETALTTLGQKLGIAGTLLFESAMRYNLANALASFGVWCMASYLLFRLGKYLLPKMEASDECDAIRIWGTVLWVVPAIILLVTSLSAFSDIMTALISPEFATVAMILEMIK